MRDGAEDEAAQVVIDEPVVRDPADLPARDRSPLAEVPELMAEGGHAHADDKGEVADAQFDLADRERVEQACARWIRQRFEQCPDRHGAVRAERQAKERPDRSGVKAVNLTAVSIDRGREHLSHGSSVTGPPKSCRGQASYDPGMRVIPRLRRVGLRGWAAAGLVATALTMVGGYVVLNSGSKAPVAWANLATRDAHSIAFVGGDPDRLLFGHHGGIFESRDGGRTWIDLRANADAMQMQLGEDGSTIIAGHDVFRSSTDGGRSWHEIANDLPGLDIHGFARDPGDPARMWAYLATGGVFESTNSGAHWQKVFADNILYLNAVRTGVATRLIGVDVSGLVASDDGGRSWHATGAPPDYPMISLVANAAGTIFLAGTPSGLYRSDDAGRTWSLTGFHQPTFAIAMTNDGRSLAAATRFGSIYRSVDGGRSWPGP